MFESTTTSVTPTVERIANPSSIAEPSTRAASRAMRVPSDPAFLTTASFRESERRS
jgi:hypothetical protein